MELRSLRYFVAVAEERHVGRAAKRLHMAQPPLSRAIRRLEDEVGSALFERTPRGVELTRAGSAMLDEARALLDHAEGLRRRVRAAAGPETLVVGTLADTVEHLGTLLVANFRKARPHVRVSVHEADLGDPSAGLRAGLVDVALTRTPFDTSGLALRTLRTESVGVVLPADDPLAARESLTTAELAGHRWVRLPDGTDQQWCDYWCVPGARPDRDSPPARTIRECLQAVLWNGATALAPLGQQLPIGLAVVPVTDRAPSGIVVAWERSRTNPLVRLFAETAATACSDPPHRP